MRDEVKNTVYAILIALIYIGFIIFAFGSLLG